MTQPQQLTNSGGRPTELPPEGWLTRRVDPLMVVGLVVGALVFRWLIPVDGWYYDDAWQVAAARGPIGQLPVLGQTQPGYTFGLMGWERVFGHTEMAMMVPALLAGVLGPAALYLILRHFRFGVPMSSLLAASLVVNRIHTRYSGRVKVYTAELLVVVVLMAAVPWLAARRWGVRSAVAWVVVSVSMGAFSSFSLIAVSGAGLIILLHAVDDRRVRLVAVGVQGVATALLAAWMQATYNAKAIAALWDGWGAMINGDSLVKLPMRVLQHSYHVVQAYPGGPSWLTPILFGVTGIGLTSAAWRGPRTVVARFLLLVTGLAIAGSIAGRVPFGPPVIRDRPRVMLWLVPIVAFGVASAVTLALRATPTAWARRALDVALVVAASALVVLRIGQPEGYPPTGGREAIEAAMAEVGPNDVVWVTRVTVPSFALYSGARYDVRSEPAGLVGFHEVFQDPHIIPMDYGMTVGDLIRRTGDAKRVIIVNTPLAPDSAQTLLELGVGLSRNGFEQVANTVYEVTSVSVFERATRHVAERERENT